MQINPSDPAMPHFYDEYTAKDSNFIIHSGLSIRAEFAARAMQGYMAYRFTPHQAPEYVAEYAVKCADALIAELNKTSQP